jgi:hypothetical protein
MATRARGRRLALALGLGSLAGLAVFSTRPSSLRLEAGSVSFRRLVRGAEADGRIRERATVLLSGLPRDRPGRLAVVLGEPAPPSALNITIDQEATYSLRTDREGVAVLTVPPRAVPALRLDLRPPTGSALRVQGLTIETSPPGATAPGMAFLLVGLLGFLLAGRSSPTLAVSLSLLTSALLALASAPAFVFQALPDPVFLWRLTSAPLLFAASLLWFGYSHTADKKDYWKGAVLLLALVAGGWVRWAFLPSAGSWDTEYWKAWMMRAVSHGTARVYGDPDSVPPGHFLSQLTGREERWQVEWRGREFVVDYPPLAMALWRWSFFAVRAAAPGLDPAEAENLAVKLPAVLGDLAAVGILLWAFGAASRGLTLAALYWALPVSWLPSAVLGFLDGAYAPLAAAALIAAGRSSPALAGGLLALACLIKPTAVVVAPAAAVALAVRVGGKGLRGAVAGGAAVVAAALVPFLLAGTLATAVVHVYRILFQQRLSGGFPNLWWVVGHLAMLREGTVDLAGPVKYARVDVLDFPASLLGTALFAAAAGFVVLRQRRFKGPGPAALAGAALFFSYSMLAIGVHENHPHPLFLILLASGLGSRALKLIAAVGSSSYVLNMLALSGLGRFYGLRYLALEPLWGSLGGLRMALGFDLTLGLALVNGVLFVALLASLKKDLASSSADDC